MVEAFGGHDAVIYGLAEIDKTSEEIDFVNTGKEVISLYRGTSAENLANAGVDVDQLDYSEGLSRDFPLYFTDSRREALDYADSNISDDNYLISAEVPFDALRANGFSANEIEQNYQELSFEPEVMYFNQVNMIRSTTELISTDVPEDWIKEIREL